MLKTTVLNASHKRLGARLIDFGGWEMPVQYDGIVAEHNRVRQDVGMFDTSHMNSIRVSGPGALDFVSRMMTADLRSLTDGRCRYGFLLRDDGGVIDDLIAYRTNAEDWMLVVNAGTAPGDFDWLQKHLPESGVTLTDLREVQSKIDVQGPNSLAVVERVLGLELGDLKFFRFRPFGEKGIISRTGYTGEVGFEIYAPPELIAEYWEKFLEAGVKPCGLGARDTLRLEAGLPLYGHELNLEVSPVEADMMRMAGKQEDFVGSEALKQRAQDPDAPRLVAFEIDGRRAARQGQRVLDAEGAEIGHVSSGSFAPTLGHVIGFAYVKQEFAKPGVDIGVDLGRQVLPARTTVAPFYKRG